MRNILLAGGAGYIGTTMIRSFISSGYSVKVLDNLIYNNRQPIAGYLGTENFEFHNKGFSEISQSDPIFSNVDSVILLGGLVGDPITKKYTSLSEEINNRQVKDFIMACNGSSIKHLIFISTCSNYGMLPENVLATEETELKPLSHYASQKVEIEKFIKENRNEFTFSTTVLRFATAFGVSPRMRFDLTVNEFARTAALGQKLEVYDADTWRPYCHVKDFADLCGKVLLARSPTVDGQTFNAGGSQNNYTKRQIADIIKKYMPKARIEIINASNDPRNYRVDFEKVRKTLNFVPKVNLEQGIREILLGVEQGLFSEKDHEPNLYGNYFLGDHDETG